METAESWGHKTTPTSTVPFKDLVKKINQIRKLLNFPSYVEGTDIEATVIVLTATFPE
jgi:hypothetical protein